MSNAVKDPEPWDNRRGLYEMARLLLSQDDEAGLREAYWRYIESQPRWVPYPYFKFIVEQLAAGSEPLLEPDDETA